MVRRSVDEVREFVRRKIENRFSIEDYRED
jgi:hypothetical protein